MSYMDHADFAPAVGIQELAPDEIDNVSGAWVANAVGAGLGAYGGAVTGYVTSGGDWRAAAVGAMGGAAVGAINPIAGLGQANRAIVSAGVGAGVGGLAAGYFTLSKKKK